MAAAEAADAEDPAYREIRETFLTAGLAALNTRSRAGSSWTQHNVPARRGALPELYAHLSATVGRARRTGRVDGFFFMHKEPGLRVRLQTRCGAAEQLCASLPGRLMYGPPVRVPYEPETYLFGGSDSMEHVHELFTVDSFAWLDQHTRPARGAEAPADWRLSLLLLREVHAGLGIVGWEHRGVWETLRSEAGRGLGTRTDPDVRRAAQGIAAYWRLSPSEMYEALPSTCVQDVREQGRALREAAERWRTAYFESGSATTGPRTAAAYFTVFHWNRARLSHARQSLLTDALADGRH
ncbi:thiopeptide-type bacteriocin biosynthesis protein [Streptomyces iconiensis]|uniref:Thiopeptide-type bacteriocin biosynthesis protein n=1 Tax=Streptomyces iconiensis TaxID=1384038 RepID=A0ABT6ZPF9_9ACTN|nr:thiopeptide-type bacteriocin biosynthesis protein [Streptomyces iconiensis]MDJ1130943.1 thiopeptide-type bacteriocin biosynthesis protein [Streptomyces iconiensis]